MNIHTTPQTVGTHNNTHQYIKIWQRGSCQLVSFLGCIHHTHTHGITRIGFCPPWKGPEGVVHKHMFFPTGVEKTKPAEFLCGEPGSRIMLFLHSQQEFPSMCCCFDLCCHSFQYKSCTTMFRMRQLANLPGARYWGRGGGKTWAQIRMLKS